MESNINRLKEITNQSTWKFFLLNLVTGGVYAYMWIWKNLDSFNEELESNSVSHKLMLASAILFGLAIFIADESEILLFIAGMMSLANCVIWIVFAFKMKNNLEMYALRKFAFTLKLNGFYTFIFNYYYINYCMNSLEEDFNKYQLTKELTNNK